MQQPSTVSQLLRQTRRMIRSFGEVLELGTLLALVAGCVNSVAFLEFGTYVSHISGHATRAAMEYTEGHKAAAYLFLWETMAFIAGAFFTAILLRGFTADSEKVKYTAPVLIEATLILFFLFLNAIHAIGWFKIGNIALSTLLLAFAMGMQNAMLRQNSGAIIRTTHMTGVATDLGFEFGTACSAVMQVVRKRGLRTIGRLLALWSVFRDALGVSRFTFHLSVFIAFFVGAILGTYAYLKIARLTLLFPALLLCLIGLQEYRRKSPSIEAS